MPDDFSHLRGKTVRLARRLAPQTALASVPVTSPGPSPPPGGVQAPSHTVKTPRVRRAPQQQQNLFEELYPPGKGVKIRGLYYLGGEQAPTEGLTPEELEAFRQIAVTDPIQARKLFVSRSQFAGKDNPKKGFVVPEISPESPNPPSLQQAPDLPQEVRENPRSKAPFKAAEAAGHSSVDLKRAWLPEELSGLLTDEEVNELSVSNIDPLVDLFTRFKNDHALTLQTAAESGKIKRGWYGNFSKHVSTLFGEHSPRLIALLAATSPKVSVEDNARNTFRVWEWYQDHCRKAGYNGLNKVPSREEVEEWILQDKARKAKNPDTGKTIRVKSTGKPVSVWQQTIGISTVEGTVHNNIVNALTDRDPGRDEMGVLSGYKVDSFRRNLLGHLNVVTNDSWMANLMEGSWKELHLRKSDQGDPQKIFDRAHGYFAMNAVTRLVAKRLNENLQPGEKPWEPAEVQETAWSFVRSLSFVIGKSRVSGHEIGKKYGPLNPEEALEKHTHGDVARTVDFVTLMIHDPDIRQRVEALGGGIAKRLAQVARSHGEHEKAIAKEAHKPAATGFTPISRRIARNAARSAAGMTSARVTASRRGQLIRFAEPMTYSPVVPPEMSSTISSPAPGNTPTLPEIPRATKEESVPSVTNDAYLAYSPNTNNDLGFDEAYQRLNAGNHRTFRGITQEVLRSSGIHDFKLHDAVGDWTNIAENSIMAVLHEIPNYDTAKYAAAWIGLLGNQKSVLLFKSDPNGPDSTYSVDVPETSGQRLRSVLSNLGISDRTIVPRKNGHAVVIYDEGRQLRNNVAKLAEHYNASVREISGRGEFVGAGSRPAARANYRKFIREFESRHARTAGVGSEPSPGADEPEPLGHAGQAGVPEGGQAAVSADTARLPDANPKQLSRKGQTVKRIPNVRQGLVLKFEKYRAPEGGIVVRGVNYTGGEFIPAEERGKASPEERANFAQKTAQAGQEGTPGQRMPDPSRTSPASNSDRRVSDLSSPIQSLITQVYKTAGSIGRKAALDVAKKVKGRYQKLESRYGRKVALTAMGAMLLLAPVPVPGSSLVAGVALAEVLRWATKGTSPSNLPVTSSDTAVAE